MRILTRYILGEVVSHALIGAAVFTFVLFTRDLGRILELVVRNSAPLPSIAEIFFLHRPGRAHLHHPDGCVGRHPDRTQPPFRRQRSHRHARQRTQRVDLSAHDLDFRGRRLAARALPIASISRLARSPRLMNSQNRLKSSQASFEVQPRVFYEGFPKIVLYVQDVKAMSGGALWKGVFLADLSDPAAPRISLAREGILVSQGPDTLDLHLTNGSTHETDPKNPDQYQISTFQTTDIPIQFPRHKTASEPSPLRSARRKFPTCCSGAHRRPEPRRWTLIEFHRRFALPTACLVLAMVGIPLGLSSKKGGKSSGFVLTILLVFLYYSLSLIGVSFARQGTRFPRGRSLAGRLSSFLLGGAFLLWQSERRPIELLRCASG